MNLVIFFNHFNPFYLFDNKRNRFNLSNHTFFYKVLSFLFWILLIPIKIVDLIGFFYLFDLLRNYLLTTRKLTEFEISEARLVFGNSLSYTKIRIRTNSKMAKKGAKYANKKTLAFVLFRCVNFSTAIDCENNPKDMARLIHELVHIKHYEKLGVEYIILALRAQRNGGYDYGGEKVLSEKHPLKYFNLEQQGDIVMKYYELLKEGKNTSIYEGLIKDLQEGKF